MKELDPKYSRQASIVPQILHDQHVVVIGVGAVGREVVRTLVCNGVPKITIFDFDIVEEHNVSTQGYHYADINRPKVECTAEEALRLNPNVEIIAVNDRWRPNKNMQFDAAFFCVDSLSMRGKLFNYFAEAVGFIGDSRIGGEQIRLLSVSDDASKMHYPTTITADATAATEGCHIPMVKHSANIAASMLVQQYIAYLKGSIVFPDRIFGLVASELTCIEGD